jgi:MFS family permease
LSDLAQKSPAGSFWHETFASLKHYNYRLWFIGQLVSMMGTWMQATAQSYLVYALTRSTVYLGLVTFVSGLATWLFTLFGGVVADRIPRRTLMVITQTSMLVLAFIQGALVFTRVIQPWHILILSFLLGVANAFDAPARVSFVTELVPREDMTNAIAVNSGMYNAAMVVGPAVAGLTYAAFGPGWCFTLNGISFIAVIVGLLLMHLRQEPLSNRRSNAFAEIGEGVHYVLNHRLVASLTAAVGVISFFGFGFMNLIPAWATDVLHGNELTYGLLVSARGFGALVAALMLASLTRRKGRGRFWIIGTLLTPLILFLFAWVRWLPLSLAVLVAIGWSMMMMTNNSNALIQSVVPDELRGRVMGIYSLVFNGAIPIGALLAGWAAAKVGDPATGVVCALALSILALVAWIGMPEVRRQD